MLVLSRRTNERIVFPGFKTAIQVLGVQGSKVSLGIDAPREVTILREELSVHPGRAPAAAEPPRGEELYRQLNHLLRNRLNIANLGLAMMARQLEDGQIKEGQQTLAKIREDFELLCDRIDTESKLQKTPPPRKAVKTAKALLVEDDQNERELLAGFLRLAGLQVDLAGDGAAALDYLRSGGHPDLILMDMVLPRCDGPSTVRAIRNDPANSYLKIFGVTGHAPETFHLDGVDRWFRKPINPERLLSDLSAALDG